MVRAKARVFCLCCICLSDPLSGTAIGSWQSSFREQTTVGDCVQADY